MVQISVATWQKTHCFATTKNNEFILLSDPILVYFEKCTEIRRNLLYAFFWANPRRLILYADVSEHSLYSIFIGG